MFFKIIAVVFSLPFFAYLLIVRRLRYVRMRKISHDFGSPTRPLSSMTLKEAYSIIEKLQTLEFPTEIDKARAYALLKVNAPEPWKETQLTNCKTGGIPTISKLLIATGQSSKKNAPKRAVDTNILLKEIQTNDVGSERHFRAIARVNYLHERYRKAGKITDNDMLHTLGSGMTEIIRSVDDSEWRRLSDVELCALGVWHRALGDAMQIPYTALPSCQDGWIDGVHFVRELSSWIYQYEDEVAVNTSSNSAFVDRYLEAKTGPKHPIMKSLFRQVVSVNLDNTMRRSMGLPKPGFLLRNVVRTVQAARALGLRHLCLPRPDERARRHLQERPNPETGLFNFKHGYSEPWYIQKSHPKQVDSLTYRAEGYNLHNVVGPVTQEGKGKIEMDATVEFLKSTGRTGCPFSSTV